VVEAPEFSVSVNAVAFYKYDGVTYADVATWAAVVNVMNF
jgi:hypothetical protein